MRGGRVTLVAAVAALLCLVLAGSASACSCARQTPRQSLADSDAAVTGRLLSIAPRGAGQAAYRYRVLRVYRGRKRIEVGSVLTVLSPRGSAACGLPERTGHSFGLFLLGDGRRWASGLCGVISPRRLWSAAGRPGGHDAGASALALSCAS